MIMQHCPGDPHHDFTHIPLLLLFLLFLVILLLPLSLLRIVSPTEDETSPAGNERHLPRTALVAGGKPTNYPDPRLSSAPGNWLGQPRHKSSSITVNILFTRLFVSISRSSRATLFATSFERGSIRSMSRQLLRGRTKPSGE